MSRSADRIRMLGSLFLLSNVVIFFLPMLSIRQENYPEQTYSQFSFLQYYLTSGSGDGAGSVSAGGRFVTVLLILIPLLLAVVAGIFRIAGHISEEYCMIAALIAGCLYLCQLIFGKGIWPERLNDAQQYVRCMGWWLLLIVTLAIFVTQGMCFLLLGKVQAHREPFAEQQNAGEVHARQRAPIEMPEPSSAMGLSEADISEEHTTSQTQTEMNLPIFSSETDTARVNGTNVETSQPRGVMVGMAGVFANKEIALRDGETLRLGRDFGNDLVFTDAAHVSRNHCRITWQAERRKFLVEDSSSNGCFINGALSRLPKNVQIALEPGTVIDIGDRTNRFRLE